MLYLKGLNLLHIMKTGGTWCRFAANRLPKSWVQAHFIHQPLSQLTIERSQLPTYAFIRNPWDWEVSMYVHLHRLVTERRGEFAGDLDEHRKRMVEVYSRPFSEVALSDESVVRRLDDHVHAMTEHDAITPIWLRYEDGVRRQFQEIVEEHIGPIPTESRRKIGAMQKINVHPHDHYRTYYDTKTRRAIERRYQDLIERFWYEF